MEGNALVDEKIDATSLHVCMINKPLDQLFFKSET